MLRGPQTAYELLSRSERMARMATIEDLKSNLDLLIGRRPPLIVEIPRAPGQREERFAHLLAGEVSVQAATAYGAASAVHAASDLEERVRLLEEEVASLKAKLADLL